MDTKSLFSKKLEAALSLLDKSSTTTEQVESLIELLKDIDPKIDKKLKLLSQSFSGLKNLLEGDIIELSAELIPENTERDKKRKKALLFFIRNWKLLKSEVERAQSQIGSKEDVSTNNINQILAKARGPFGIITVSALALVVVAAFLVVNKFSQQKASLIVSSTEIPKISGIKYIEYMGKKITLDEIIIKNGPDCNAPHYHARNGVFVKSSDGETIQDPGACAFGKVSETKVIVG